MNSLKYYSHNSIPLNLIFKMNLLKYNQHHSIPLNLIFKMNSLKYNWHHSIPLNLIFKNELSTPLTLMSEEQERLEAGRLELEMRKERLETKQEEDGGEINIILFLSISSLK